MKTIALAVSLLAVSSAAFAQPGPPPGPGPAPSPWIVSGSIISSQGLVPYVDLNSVALPAYQTGTALQLGQANGVTTRAELDSFAAPSRYTCVREDGTAASPTTLQANDEICSLNSFGYNGSAIVGPAAAIRTYAAQNWTTGANGTYVDIATIANGATTLTSRVRFENDGGITVPSTVTGGDEGAGTINAAGLYVNGVAVGTGGVASLGNYAADTTLTITGTGSGPWTGTVTAKLNLGNANTWTAVQTFTNSDIRLLGSSTGYTTLTSANAGSSNYTVTIQAATDTLVGRATTDTLTNKTLASTTDVLGGVTMTLGSDATGDIYYRNSSGYLTRLAIGSSTNVLTVSGGLPAWGAAPAATLVSGTTAVSGGSTSCPLFNSSGGLFTAGCTLPGAITVTGNITASGTGATIVTGTGGFLQQSTPMAFTAGLANMFFGGGGNTTLSGNDNNAIGTAAGAALTTGAENELSGSESGRYITTGSNNACYGFETCHALTTESGIVAVGNLAGYAIAGVSYVIAIGDTAEGSAAGSPYDIAVGVGALGHSAGSTGYNIAIGGNGLTQCTTCYKNITIGQDGGSTGYPIVTGHGNVWFGGYQNVGTTDYSDTFFLSDGEGAGDFQLDYGISNSGAWTFYGGKIFMTGVNNASGNEILCYDTSGGPVTYENAVAGCVPSSIDLKNPAGLIDTSTALQKVMTLQPAIYTYKDTKTFGSKQYDGLYAQQVCAMDDNLCDYENGEVHNYDKVGLTAYLVAAIKAQQAEISQLKTELNSNSKKD